MWLQKYARIFVLGHYLFQEAQSLPRASISENCSLLGTDNVKGQISVHISTIAPFYHIRAKNAQNMPRYYTVIKRSDKMAELNFNF